MNSITSCLSLFATSLTINFALLNGSASSSYAFVTTGQTVTNVRNACDVGISAATFTTRICASSIDDDGMSPLFVNRRAFATDLIRKGAAAGVVAAGATGSSWPRPANADITNKVASSSALRNVKSVQKKLLQLESYVVMETPEYLTIKESLRVAPFSDVRKSCTTLVRGGEDTSMAQDLEAKYKTFIASLEKMDSTASLALRGKRFTNNEFELSYQATVQALQDFIVVAEEAASIPVQYSDS